MTQFNFFEPKQQTTVIVFLYEVFNFFDFRNNKGQNTYLYYFIFLVLIGMTLTV